jgi:hypothetical protein
MTAAVDFDPDTGTLLASEHALQLLLAYLASGRWPPRTAETEELYALRDAGAVHGDGQPAEALAPSLAVVLRPQRTVELSVGDYAVRAWVLGPAATLLAPLLDEPDERRKLLQFPASLLPETLARLLDLGPRSGTHQAVTIDEAGLSRARHWRLHTAKAPTNGATEPRQHELHIADAGEAFWQLTENSTRATPLTSTELWRLLARHTLGCPGQ